MFVCRLCLVFILFCLNTSQGLEVDTMKFEKLMILPRSNKIPKVGQAADGDTATCIQYTRQPRKNARVWIDLRGLHNVHRVIIRHSGTDSNSDLQMMKNIHIRLSNTTSASKKKDCFTNYDDIPSDGALDTATYCVSKAIRSVYVIRPTELRFCEVEVYGCVSGRWGAACENNCGECAAGDACDSITGNCPGTCAKGWNGYLCNIATATTTTTTKATTPQTLPPPTTTKATPPQTLPPPTSTKATPPQTLPPPTSTKATTPQTLPTQTTIKAPIMILTTKLTTNNTTMNSLPRAETVDDNTTTTTTDTNMASTMPSNSTPDVVTTDRASESTAVGQTKQTPGVTQVAAKGTSGELQFPGLEESTTPSAESRLNISSFSTTLSSVTSGNAQMYSTSTTRTFSILPTDSTSDVQTKGISKVTDSTSLIWGHQYSTTEEITVNTESVSNITETAGEETSSPSVSENTTGDTDTATGTTQIFSSPITESTISQTNTYSDWSGDGTEESQNDSPTTTRELDNVSSDMHLTETVTDIPVTTREIDSESLSVYFTGSASQPSNTVNISDDVTKSTQLFEDVDLTDPNRKKTPVCKGFTCSKNNLVVLVGIVVAFLFITTLIATVYIYRRRVRQKRNQDFEKGDSFKTFNGLPLPDIAAAAKAYGSNGDIKSTQIDDTRDTTDKEDYDVNASLLVPCNLSSFSPSQAKSTAVRDIQDHITMMKDKTLFNKDFMNLPGADISPCNVGTNRKNSKKNRYANITTFDESRVTLTTNGDVENDYINASYIDSFEQPKTYIATQGPLKHTSDDFWRMIWQEHAEKIVMLTELQENKKTKCVQYWPGENEKMSVGSLSITMENEYHFPVYKLRTFCITESRTKESRKVTQFQFTAWPDHGVPEVFPLILFHDRVISQHSDMTGPMVVHCSAGVGRTGTFIAIDALSEQGRKTGHVTIHLFVEYMRRCRPRMVQTLDQYVFLHTVLMEMFLCPGSLVEAESLRDTWKINGNGTHTQAIREEYQRLQGLRPRYGGEAYSAGHQACNSSKNGTTVLPVNDYRVVLNSEEDYINAVTMPNLGSKPGYIVTEIPVSTSKDNFWQMIYEQKCNVIVCLDHPLDETGVSILPETEQEQTYGAFSVRHGETVLLGPHGIQRETFTLTRDNEVNEVAVFYLPTWKAEDQLPPTCASLISLHQETQKWQENKGQGRVIVVCRDGAERCGLYCAVCNMMECIDWYNRVDIFHTVRHLQIRRPEVIQNLMQYSYCFDLAVAYTDTSDGTCIKLPDDTVFVSPTTSV
ncbi:receptor-type tyrosine-protein phosphatase alpha-like [Pecten maximus]|uniref:receptor-type tyrosine-protein phosphatase alpha-like n=1 Tax=Pecten maximus TaxID=6579 RepID=UPI001458D96A|nr:receptor-type tyrosine-protein phosphatase alpha-like [Pecten maximus]